MNRRDFLKMAGLGVAGWVLTGCGIQSRREAFEEKQVGSKVQNMDGVCIYCGHCQPCIKAIDIAAVNKFYDLAQAGDALAKEHYLQLPHKAGDCIQCGHCEPRCPFHVAIRERMKQTKAYFGE